MRWEYRYTLLALSALAFFVTFFARVAISPVVPFITDDFGISNTRIGIGLSGMWVAYGLSQYPSGLLADRFGERRIMLLSVGGTTVLAVAAAVAPLFPVLALGMVGIGLLAGFHYPAATTLLSRTYDNMGTAVAVHSLGAPVAGLVAPTAAAWIALRYGWRPAVALVALLGVPTFALIFLAVRPTPPRDADAETAGPGGVGSFASFLRTPSIAFFALVAVLAMFPLNGLMSFLPTFLVEYHGYSPTLAGGVFSVFFVVRGVSQLGVGPIADRIDRETVVSGCLLLGTLGVGLFLLGPGFVTVGLGVLSVGIGYNFFTALEPKILDSLSAADRNAGFGVFRTVYVAGGATGSVGMGALADAVGWYVTFVAVAGIFSVSVILVTANRVLGTY
jgi:predicted MFS family arabinose efflux permease